MPVNEIQNAVAPIVPPRPLQMAYVRKMREYDEEFYGIYDENGQPLAIAPTRDLAFLTIRQHDLEPVDVH